MSDPWAEFTPAPARPAAADPWAEFAPATPRAPLSAAAGATGEAGPSSPMLADVSRSIDTGLTKGVAGWIGGPAMVPRGVAWLADQAKSAYTGRPYEEIKAENDARALVPTTTVDKFGPSAIEGAMRRHIPGAAGVLDYQPQTLPGEYAKTIGEFLPAGALNPGAAVASAIGSETAGQLTKGTPFETPARIAGGIVAPSAARRLVTQPGAARAPFVRTLQDEGVPLTAGDVSGSRVLRGMENTLGNSIGSGGAAERAAEETAHGFNRAVARRMGEDAGNLGPETMQRASARIGQQFRDLSSRNTLQYDPQMGRDIADVSQTYWRSLPPAQRQIFADWREAILDHLRQNQAQIPGDVYQRTRSQLSRASNNIAQSDPELSRALGGLRTALDDAMSRSVRPEDAAAWNTARQQYGNMRTIERATPDPTGNVSPASLRSAVAARNRPAYVRGQSDLGEIARAGAAVLRPIPNSGTAERGHAIAAATAIPTSIGASLMTGDVKPFLATLAATAGPGVAGRALMSAPVQWALRNRAYAPENIGPLARIGQAASRALIAAPR